MEEELMENSSQKKISRRDAIKLLAAAVGAATVANLPSEWSKPAMAASELPEHAQQSVGNGIVTAGPDVALECNQQGIPFTSTATITPARSGVFLHYAITADPGVTLISATSGTLATGASGDVSLIVGYGSGSVTVTWSFVNPADGSGSDSQTASNTGC